MLTRNCDDVMTVWHRILASVGLLWCGLATAAGTLNVSTVQEAGSARVIAINASAMPVWVSLTFTRVDNSTVPTAPILKVVPPHAETILARITPKQPEKPSHFEYRYTETPGDPGASADTHARYLLPFPSSIRAVVTQSPDGPRTTHQSRAVEQALDIAMPVGTPVLASRGGVVVEIVDGFGEGKLDASYMDKTNYVKILHTDGTWAEYLHLARSYPALRLGVSVSSGQQIGWSGNSGYSSGPHLHFVLQRNAGGDVVSLPVSFWDKRHGSFDLTYHQVLEGSIKTVGSYAAVSAPIRRSLKQCIKPGNLIDAAVLKCMNG